MTGKILIVVLSILFGASVGGGQTRRRASRRSEAAGKSARQALLELDRVARDAAVQGNVATLRRIWAKDYTSINPDGIVRNREELLSLFTSGAVKYDAVEVSDLDVRIVGNMGILTGRSSPRQQFMGKSMGGPVRFTRVYVRYARGWKLVASQSTYDAGQMR
jgi:hypothetical protein